MHPVFKTPVFNRGIEIAAPFGASISAVASGRVLHAAPMEGFGELVVLDHGGGMMSVYGYGSKVLVHVGDGVAAGDTLAEVGEPDTGREPSLYFEIRQGAKALDPFTYLRRH
jgi:septal ring factor EnvC (AmiA/AmiB activator)